MLAFCVLGAIGSAMFCSNWGFTHLQVVNFQVLYTYILPFVGILECAGAGWFHKESHTRVRKTRKWVRILQCSYWIPLTLSGLVHLFDTSKFLLSIGIFWGIQLACIILFKFLMDCDKVQNNTWDSYIHEYVLYGAYQLAVDILELSHEAVF